MEFLCVFIGRLKLVTSCVGECPALSFFRLLFLRVERGEPGWLTWSPVLVVAALVGESCVGFDELCDTFPRRLVGL